MDLEIFIAQSTYATTLLLTFEAFTLFNFLLLLLVEFGMASFCFGIGDCGCWNFIGNILFGQTVLGAIKYTVNFVDNHFSSVSRTTHKLLGQKKTFLSSGHTVTYEKLQFFQRSHKDHHFNCIQKGERKNTFSSN